MSAPSWESPLPGRSARGPVSSFAAGPGFEGTSGSASRFFSRMSESAWLNSLKAVLQSDKLGAASPNFSSMTFSSALNSSTNFAEHPA